ncbi:phosphohistidine phosphatase, SixA [Halothece sp. PCC 7418]|uniref:phosphohistidine phosphatase SixA n=1 Tax=Halothece sp. (strain PCC 7418) TaxID=65093 RepID=UPI0002A084E1|nr:phosphohistidine phosphatase SixA [Halothece sp. PCC 7418]AFZ42664.1 phosphohistidine phosphatase, SixA [Halothece sp. PCC 7418]
MSKQLYLIRHGIAVDRAPSQPDETRPLTEEGQKKTQKIAKEIQNIGVTFDLILTSPLLRATQTAEILREVGLTETVETFSALAPGGNLQDWVQWWEHLPQHHKTIALVGHQPDLGNWAELLVWGETQEKLVVKKAGVIGLNCPDQGSPLGRSELFLLTPPKWLLRN